MIHVCFGLYDKTGRYSKFTGTAILSIFENTKSEVTVHIIHDNTVSADNRDKFTQLAERYNQRVKLYNVEELCADKVTEITENFPDANKTRYSIAMFYRLFIPQLLSSNIEKAIYLDSDIIVNFDINKLWNIELSDKPLAAVPVILNFGYVDNLLCDDNLVKIENYFNSGVLLMNLKVFRAEKEKLMQGIRFISEHPRYSGHLDQDILNYCFASRAVKLPADFNHYVLFARSAKESVSKKIYHYVGQKSLKLDMNDSLSRLWMSYFIKTSWFDTDSIGRLYKGVQKIHVELKAAMVRLSALMSGKTRAFFALPQDIEMLKIFFTMRDDEEVILAETQQSLQELIDAMKRARGKKIFFIIIPNFPFNILIQAGFVYGEDFLNGIEFLSEANGVPFNSYSLINAM